MSDTQIFDDGDPKVALALAQERIAHIDDRTKAMRDDQEAMKKDIMEIKSGLSFVRGLDQRVTNIEQWRWHLVGGMAVIVFILTLFGPTLRAALKIP